MADVVKDVLIRIGLQQIEARLQAPDVEPVKRAAASVDDAVSKANERMEKSFAEVQKEIEKANAAMDAAAKAREQEAGRVAKAQENSTEHILRAGNALREAAEGAFIFARGLAFISARTEEDFQQALRTIAGVQGAFDIFRGGIQTIKGLVEAHKALTLAAQASTVAHIALRVALGPIGIALGAAAVAVGFLAKAWADNRREEERAMRLEEEHVAIMKRRREELERIAEAQRKSRQPNLSDVLQGHIEHAGTLPPEQRIQALAGIDVARTSVSAINQALAEGDRKEATQLAEDRKQQDRDLIALTQERIRAEEELLRQQQEAERVRQQSRIEQAEQLGGLNPFVRGQLQAQADAAIRALEDARREEREALQATLQEQTRLSVENTRRLQVLEQALQNTNVMGE